MSAATIGAAAALGVAGLDPAGALLVAAALAHRAARASVAVFAVVALAGTVALGVGLSLTTARGLERLAAALPGLVAHPVAAVVAAAVEVTVAVALVVVALRGGRRGPGRRRAPWFVPTTPLRAVLVGAVFAAGAALDPSFLAVVATAARADLGTVFGAHAVWAVVGQLPLVAVTAAVLLGGQGPALRALESALDRARPWARVVRRVLLPAVAAGLLLDAGLWAVGVSGAPLLVRVLS